LENILKIFQIKQLFLSNQVGGCWSFYREHTQILVFRKRLSIFARGKKWILPFGIVSHLKYNGCLILACKKFPQWGSNYMKVYTFLFRNMQTLGG
jgi:hypothetical protein